MLLVCLILAFGFALTSFLLSRRATLAFTGVLLSALAIVLGGTSIEIKEFDQSLLSISLDWLLIDILVLSAIFIPIELFLPKRPAQTKLHLEWKTDLVYFAVGHLLVQYTAIVVKYPAENVLGGFGMDAIQAAVKGWPFVAQLLVAMLLADLISVHGAPRLPCEPLPVALSRGASFDPGRRLARRIEIASGRHRGDQSVLLYPAISLWLFDVGVLHLRRHRGSAGGGRPRQHPHSVRLAEIHFRHTAVPPLAPCG